MFFMCILFFGHAACGILVPRTGIELASPAVEMCIVLTTGLPGSPHHMFYETDY